MCTPNIESSDLWINFLKWIESMTEDNLFRGVSDKINHLLIPGIGRKNFKHYSLNNEIQTFEQFKLRANIYTKANSDFEWLAIAQHHGLPTRLLDWTRNPLIAAFFAIKENYDKDARVYSVNVRSFSFLDLTKYNNPFSVNRIHFIYPPISTNRLELQKGVFSIHPLPTKPAIITHDGLIEMEYAYVNLKNGYQKYSISPFKDDPYNYQETFYKDNNFDCFFDIPASSKSYFEKQIRRFGIDEMIFGDIDSISKHLTYEFSNNLTKKITTPDFTVSFPILNKLLIPKLREYIEKNPDSISFLSHSFCIDSDLNIVLDEVVLDNHYNSKVVKGNLHSQLFLNIWKGSSIFMQSIECHKAIQIVSRLLKEVYGLSEFGYALFNITFHANMIFTGIYENINFSKVVNFSWDKSMSDFLSTVINELNIRYDKCLELLSIISLDEIEKIEVDGEDFPKIVEKIKYQISSK